MFERATNVLKSTSEYAKFSSQRIVGMKSNSESVEKTL